MVKNPIMKSEKMNNKAETSEAKSNLTKNDEPAPGQKNLSVFIVSVTDQIDRRASLMEELQSIVNKFTGEDLVEYNRAAPAINDVIGYNDKMEELKIKMQSQNNTLEDLINELNNYL
jgi:seryl-tRNA(Sec) selenium transferase